MSFHLTWEDPGGGNDSAELTRWAKDAHRILRGKCLKNYNFILLKHNCPYSVFESELVMATKLDGYDGFEYVEGDGQHVRWSFSGALLFSITVITTIGMISFLLYMVVKYKTADMAIV